MLPYTFIMAQSRCEGVVSAAKRLRLPPNSKVRLDWKGNLDSKGDVRVWTDSKGNYTVSITVRNDGHMGRCTYDYSDVQGAAGSDQCSEMTQLNESWSLFRSLCD